MGRVVIGIEVVGESCLVGIGDAGDPMFSGSDRNGNVSSSAAVDAALIWLFLGNLGPYGDGDGLEPSKLLFALEIYAKENCKNVPKHTRNHVLYENPTLFNSNHHKEITLSFPDGIKGLIKGLVI